MTASRYLGCGFSAHWEMGQLYLIRSLPGAHPEYVTAYALVGNKGVCKALKEFVDHLNILTTGQYGSQC